MGKANRWLAILVVRLSQNGLEGGIQPDLLELSIIPKDLCPKATSSDILMAGYSGLWAKIYIATHPAGIFGITFGVYRVCGGRVLELFFRLAILVDLN